MKARQPLKKVGSYRLIFRIGSGATSQVFQAYKQNSPQKFAIKMIRLKSLTQNQRQMIFKQISIIKSINHNNIVKLYDTLQTSNNFYLIFQYCQRGDLQKYLKKAYGSVVPEGTVQKIMYCIGHAIHTIHQKGIVHRDIKLANILINKQFIIKLADFGFAKQIDSQQLLMKTYCGTPITMAPQILMNKLYDKKCDVWSLGVVMYQLVYGKLPFAINQGYHKFVEKVIKQTVKIPTHPQMPLEFKNLLMRCLQKDPEKRCSIEEFIQNDWVGQGKDKILEQRNSQKYNDMREMLKDMKQNVKKSQKIGEKQQNKNHNDITYSDNDDDQDQDNKIMNKNKNQRNRIIQYNTAQKLYNFLKSQFQKIIQSHIQTRSQIHQLIQKQINLLKSLILKQQSSQKLTLLQQQLNQYNKMLKLLYYLDDKYIIFLNQLKVKVVKDSQQVQVKVGDVYGVKMPGVMRGDNVVKDNSNIISNKQQKENMLVGETIMNFLKSSPYLTGNLSFSNQHLQKKKQNYSLVQKYLTLIRSYQLNVSIIFGHHFHHQQISLSNLLIQFKQMGKQLSQSLIKDQSDNDNDNQQKLQNLTFFQQNLHQRESSNKDQNYKLKYDKYSNFITIWMQYKQKNEKVKELRENLKNICERMVDQITKTQQGYYCC